MDFLECVTMVVYALVVVRSFSFGIYGLKQGRGGTFAIVLFMLAVSGVLLWRYVVMNV